MLLWLMNQGSSPFMGGSDPATGPSTSLRTLALTGAGLALAGLLFMPNLAF